MTEKPVIQQKETRLKLYYFALGFYIIAPIFLLIFIADMLTVKKTEMLFWALFLLSLFPCALIGFALSLIGWIISSKRTEKSNTTIGMIATLLGGAGIMAGLLGWGLLYVVLGP